MGVLRIACALQFASWRCQRDSARCCEFFGCETKSVKGATTQWASGGSEARGYYEALTTCPAALGSSAADAAGLLPAKDLLRLQQVAAVRWRPYGDHHTTHYSTHPPLSRVRPRHGGRAHHAAPRLIGAGAIELLAAGGGEAAERAPLLRPPVRLLRRLAFPPHRLPRRQAQAPLGLDPLVRRPH